MIINITQFNQHLIYKYSLLILSQFIKKNLLWFLTIFMGPKDDKCCYP